MSDVPETTTAEADQMMEEAGRWASAFVARMANNLIAHQAGDEAMAAHFLAQMVDVLAPLTPGELCLVVWELAQRLIYGMVEQVGGLPNLREALAEGLVLGMTTNQEVAFSDLPPL